MGGFGFMNLGQAAQGQPPMGQQQPQTVGTMPQGQTATQDPRSVYLQQALSSLGGGQNAPKTGMAAGSDLLAEALDRYALGQRQKQLGQQQQGQQAQSDWNALQGGMTNLGPGDLRGPQVFAPGS